MKKVIEFLQDVWNNIKEYDTFMVIVGCIEGGLSLLALCIYSTANPKITLWGAWLGIHLLVLALGLAIGLMIFLASVCVTIVQRFNRSKEQ